MRTFSFPLRYLKLQTESGSRLWVRDMPGALLVTCLLVVPYAFISGANFFHKDGFVDKIGTFASVLTGFYVAGLVAVATFPKNEAGLDKEIEVGKIKVPTADEEEPEYLTRREYVCSMFGYLAFMSMIVTILSIVCVTSSVWFDQIKSMPYTIAEFDIDRRQWLRVGAITICSVVLSQMFVTTVRGLYYLIDRIYAVAPTPLPRKDDDR